MKLSGGKVKDAYSSGSDKKVEIPNEGDIAFEPPEWALPTGSVTARNWVRLRNSNATLSLDIDLTYEDGCFYFGDRNGSTLGVEYLGDITIEYPCSAQPSITGGEPVSMEILKKVI